MKGRLIMSIRNILSNKAKESVEIKEVSITELVNNYSKYTEHLTSMDIQKIKAVKETIADYRYERAKTTSINSDTEGGRIFKDLIGDSEQEELVVISLDTKNKVIGIDHIFKGTLNSTVAHPREILRTVLKYPTARFMIGHNHPSGDLEASSADISFTERIVESGELIGIDCLDHFIVGKYEGYTSMRAEGYM